MRFASSLVFFFFFFGSAIWIGGVWRLCLLLFTFVYFRWIYPDTLLVMQSLNRCIEVHMCLDHTKKISTQ